ncbi:MAG: hypothetical protein R2712_12800 [Vicinamibacterales bacterium]
MRGAESGGAALRIAAAVVAPALAVCGLPLARNLTLYGEVTGLGYALRLMREAQGLVIEPPVSLAGLAQLAGRGFVVAATHGRRS